MSAFENGAKETLMHPKEALCDWVGHRVVGMPQKNINNLLDIAIVPGHTSIEAIET